MRYWIFLFGLFFSLSVIDGVYAEDANNVGPEACKEELLNGFTKIDALFGEKHNELLSLNSISGVGKAKATSGMMRTYSCHLKALCGALNYLPIGDEASVMLEKKVVNPIDGCEEMTVSQVQEEFGVDLTRCDFRLKERGGVYTADDAQRKIVWILDRCDSMKNAKQNITKDQYARSFQQDTVQKLEGFLVAKIIDMLKRMEVLREEVSEFQRKFLTAYGNASCTLQ
jgi:hypothetical protein